MDDRVRAHVKATRIQVKALLNTARTTSQMLAQLDELLDETPSEGAQGDSNGHRERVELRSK